MAMANRTRMALAVASGLMLAGVAPGKEPAAVPAVVGQFCVGCHGPDAPRGDLDLASVASEPVARHPLVWEKVVRRLRAGQMPPDGRKRPAEATYTAVLADLETAL